MPIDAYINSDIKLILKIYGEQESKDPELVLSEEEAAMKKYILLVPMQQRGFRICS